MKGHKKYKLNHIEHIVEGENEKFEFRYRNICYTYWSNFINQVNGREDIVTVTKKNLLDTATDCRHGLESLAALIREGNYSYDDAYLTGTLKRNGKLPWYMF